jgi:uncharacterized membrane protein HdeD (DUF308 family)
MKRKTSKAYTHTALFSKLILALCELILGVVLLINPVKFTSIIISVAGLLLLAGGLVSILRYFKASPAEAAVGQDLTQGLLGIIAGLFCIVKSEWFIVTFPLLTVLYGVITLITGVSKIQWTVDLLRNRAEKWFWAAISAAITLICSAVILGNPFTSTFALWTFIAVTLVVEAVFDVIAAIFAKGDNMNHRFAREDISNEEPVAETQETQK